MADRAQLEAYLQSRSLAYPADATDEELSAQVLGVIDEEHERFLQGYQAVVTRLPVAVGSAPEQPTKSAEQSGAAPPETQDALAPPVESVALDEQAQPGAQAPAVEQALGGAAVEASSGEEPA